MNKEVVIREIRKGEETKACQLVIECFNEFVAPDYGDEGVNEFLKYVNPDWMQERLEHGNFAFVAVVDDLITGVIEVRSNNHISLLFVRKEYQGRGIRFIPMKLKLPRFPKYYRSLVQIQSLPLAVLYSKLIMSLII